MRNQRVVSPPKGTSRGSQRGERGQAIIEFALLFPFVIVLAFLILDTALALDRREVLDHALREGTRAATLGSTEAAVQQSAAGSSEGLLHASDVSVCYEDVDGNGQVDDTGDNVVVSVDYTYDFVFGGELLELFGVSDPSMSIDAKAAGRLEKDIQVASSC